MAQAAATIGRAVRSVLTATVDSAEAAGLLAATTAVGRSFDRGLLPRPPLHQAGLTGVVTAVNYGLTVTSQSAIEAFARRVTGGQGRQGGQGRTRARTAILATDLLAVGAGIAVQAALPQRPGERLVRPTVRSLGWRVTVGGLAGSIVTGVDAAWDRLHGQHSPGRAHALLTVAAGAGLGTALHLWQNRRAVAAGAEADAAGKPVTSDPVRVTRRAVVVGSGVATGLYLVSRVESAAAAGVGRAVGWAAPSLAPSRTAIGHGVVLAAAGYAGYRGLGQVYRSTEQAGAAIEPAYATVPTSAHVSGGPGSLVEWSTFGREGRRFVNMALTAAAIAEVTGATGAADPIRAYAGLASAPTAGERVELAMDELERLGAFDRSVLAVFSPTGTGYVNYVAAETLEYLTGGDCASVAVQYSVRPSFLSLDRVRTAWEGNLTLLTALSWRLRAIPAERRPRLLLFGESLGSQAAQDVFWRQGTRGFERLGIDRALFIGTPYASRWREAWLDDAEGQDPHGRVVEVDSIGEWHALPEQRRATARIVLLTHHADPIPKFGLPLLVQAPRWLGPPETREPGIPPEMRWNPLTTFFSTLVDLLNADHVVPGRFEAYGHDYRKDLAELVRAAFDLPVPDETLARVEAALRRRELRWATRRLVTARLADAEGSLREQLTAWGVDPGSIPTLLGSASPEPADPYAAR